MSPDVVAILISTPALAFLLYLALSFQGRKKPPPKDDR